MSDQVVLMNVRIQVTQEQGGIGDDGSGPCEIRAYRSAHAGERALGGWKEIANAHVPELPREEVGDALIDTIMCCAVEHDLEPPDDVPVDERPYFKREIALTDDARHMETLRAVLPKADAVQRAQATALINAAIIVARDNPSGYDLINEAISIDTPDGGTFYVTITKEPPK